MTTKCGLPVVEHDDLFERIFQCARDAAYLDGLGAIPLDFRYGILDDEEALWDWLRMQADDRYDRWPNCECERRGATCCPDHALVCHSDGRMAIQVRDPTTGRPVPAVGKPVWWLPPRDARTAAIET